jgi:putative membrane protein
MGGESDELAEQRTGLAQERTVLANERTFAGWVRTGLAAVGVGLGFHALFNKLEPAWVGKAIATAFLTIAIFVLLSTERGSRRVAAKVARGGADELAPVNLRLIAYAASAATLALIVAIWALEVRGG